MNNQHMRQPIVLNFDDSTGIPENAFNLNLNPWQEMIRFGCKWSQFNQLSAYLTDQLPQNTALGCTLIGSGDYHHITQYLLNRLKDVEPFHLIVCDNHPDNMRYPFGIHCGSWVYWASLLPQVARIDVIGIGSSDIGWKHAWENHWSPLRHGKLHYWSIQQNASWTRWIGASDAWFNFQNPDDLMQEFLSQISSLNLKTYLSIDKDVLSKDVVMTNWDQGFFLEHHLKDLITQLKGKLIGADITGDISEYRYQSFFKRFLSASDGQGEELLEENIKLFQINQKKLNKALIEMINQSWVND
ncbi:hypothetical protein P255_00510 [Acinetobacter brisouii CIP 110357]|uniref:Arginase n=1 Tax=Acinetobacter brisouii CIP 110357 TaxID=1341683 RepID=V2VXA2_9GAMM|nr:hypothetical protein [Acinetobacter brisouii]ENV46371.1 hypothetical protein F954_02350 [Acinetobacter brisouii ANC 4119]ESK52359.1 hypothetical protein P255_00510 [Acinetobacter brisouii CIP 110357]